eukprot:NODE_9099_length_620_cov_71.044266_g8471_i0.p1 GENE.NODE_9099_length_620_cov_71.044266_g8471_i0~~NODE_9099_length_620_cov_71.044266_g8471_i0.p1  ORF type:complete len:172 (-),score=25.53 NODE_9099_length_620_cov_71.044266_g8471_i0:38-553(-)
MVLGKNVPKFFKTGQALKVISRSLAIDRIRRNMLLYTKANLYYYPGGGKEWRGAKASIQLTTNPPLEINGIVFKRRAGRSTNEKGYIQVFERDDSPLRNHRLYTIPMVNPFVKIDMRRHPDQEKEYLEALQEWRSTRYAKPMEDRRSPGAQKAGPRNPMRLKKFKTIVDPN